MKLSFIQTVLITLFFISTANALRNKKQFGLSVFNILTFENVECEATGNNNGTCYTAEECTSLGGTAQGSCAQEGVQEGHPRNEEAS